MTIITDAQHGFRKRCSCELQLILTVTVEDLAGEIDKGGQTDVILLDFSKASDMVPQKHLRGKTKRWNEDFLTKRTQQVVVKGKHPYMGSVTSGVP